jgi:hypothetical protein
MFLPRYHRLLKREKLKKQLKEFEELQKTNPGAALEKLQEMELQRIEERANLRHKNSGKWAPASKGMATSEIVRISSLTERAI